MKTLALAGLMTVSAIMGSVLTLTLSQASFAQDAQRAAANPAPQTGVAPSSIVQTSSAYTEYSFVGADSQAQMKERMAIAKADGWVPQGGVSVNSDIYNHLTYWQAVVR